MKTTNKNLNIANVRAVESDETKQEPQPVRRQDRACPSSKEVKQSRSTSSSSIFCTQGQ